MIMVAEALVALVPQKVMAHTITVLRFMPYLLNYWRYPKMRQGL
jgi:hypothetical protein